MSRLKKGERAFLLENNRNVVQVEISDCYGGIYTVRLPGGGASKVKAHRLFATPEEAEESRQRRKLPSFRMSDTRFT